ncbi:MAG: methyl-accepting chemotaxis protein [Peptococcaceae bacterium]|nr:methyl-accepting chemotaxis protein [Peptococcaceae bacterium]
MAKKEKNIQKAISNNSFLSRIGLRGKMIIAILIPLFLILVFVGTLVSNETSATVGDLKRSEIDAQTDSAAKLIDDFFHPFLTSTEVVVDLDCIQEIFAQILQESPDFDIRNAANYEEVLHEMKEIADKQGEGMITLWIVADHNNQLLHSNGNTTGEDFVLATRPWFQQLVANNGETIVTSAYEDVVSGEMVVSCATAVYKPGTKEIIGAVGMDISLQSLITQIGDMVIGEAGYISAYDCDNVLLCHPQEELLLQGYQDIPYSENMHAALAQQQSTAAIEYTLNDAPYCGSVIYIPDIGWHIIGSVTEAEYQSDIKDISMIVILGFTLCLALISAIVVFVATTIVKPLRKLNEVTAQLANGDLDVDVQSTSSDEVGQMAANISALVDRLKTYILYIDEVSGVIDEIGRGNLVFELKQDYVGEFNRMKVALNEIQSSLSSTVVEIVNSAMRVDENTAQIATASQRLAQGSVEQASTIEELFATVQDLTGKSVEDSKHFIELSKDIRSIGDELSDSNNSMQQMVEAMENITTQSQQIAQIIKTIEDIAFQTNILALNAAIEAARAGSSGKGFAVVADEVRNLATKSSEAAKSITDLIQSSVQAVEDGSKIADNTAAALNSVADDVSKVVNEMEKFADRYQQQSTDLENVTVGIDQISAVVQNNSATAEENAATSEELAALVQVMRDLTEKFEIDEQYR